MGVPATTGTLRTTLASMLVGDYIAFNYDTAGTGVAGTFSNLGSATGSEIPITGIAVPSVANGDLAYFMKVDRGTLISDRILQIAISWNVLQAAQLIEGKVITLNSVSTLVRSLSGGTAFADANGSLVLTDQSLGGYPTNNEYDRYIVNSDLNQTITKGNNNVWHWQIAYYTRVKDTIDIEIAAATQRVNRGYSSIVQGFSYAVSTATTVGGFRPVLNYLDGGSATTLFY